MLLQEYQEQVKRSCPDLGSYQLNIAHMIFGMNSEFNELYGFDNETNLSEELSDYAWYLCNYCNFTEIDLWRICEFIPTEYYKILEFDDYIVNLQVQVSKLTDLEKKELAYKKQVDRDKRIEFVVNIFYALNDCFTYYNINAFDSMQKNIDKLKVRYPEKFTEEKALNRDLEKEKQVLEGK